jgi:hypothetical protein
MDSKFILLVVETFAERCRRRALKAQPGNPLGLDSAMRSEIDLLKKEIEKQEEQQPVSK